MTKTLGIACTLMRMALALLDREGEELAAAFVQRALDAVDEGRGGDRPCASGRSAIGA